MRVLFKITFHWKPKALLSDEHKKSLNLGMEKILNLFKPNKKDQNPIYPLKKNPNF